MSAPDCAFLKAAGRILNSGQSRSLALTGNVHDLFRMERPAPPTKAGSAAIAAPPTVDYVPLIDFLSAQWDLPDHVVVVYELNGPIRFLRSADRDRLRDAWTRWRTGLDTDAFAIENMLTSGKAQARMETMGKTFDASVGATSGNSGIALEFLRQLCLCSRTVLTDRNLIVLIEAVDMLVPEGPITNLPDADRQRVAICQDWFADPGFVNGGDAVILLAESLSQINSRIARLPQVVEVPIASPDQPAREALIAWFADRQPEGRKPQYWSTPADLARLTAGLSFHALLQLLKAAAHENRPISQDDVVAKVEDFIQSQLGDDVVEFKKPTHSLEDVVGFTTLKAFLRRELIPRFKATGAEALPGAAVCGPIGGGKTYIFEALASEVDMVVLVLKNIRSKWFGETDVIFERLRRVLDALAKVLIFVDEADTQFGGLGDEEQATEKRLTGKIQAMMSDTGLRGRVVWLLMTARIHLLSPDIRRPGRVGDLIIPILDPDGADREEFLRWTLKPVIAAELPGPSDQASTSAPGNANLPQAGGTSAPGNANLPIGSPATPASQQTPTSDLQPQASNLKPAVLSPEQWKSLLDGVSNFFAAGFASLRSELKARMAVKGAPLTVEEVQDVVHDLLQPAVSDTRRYQTLQALVNCTRRSLLPDPKTTEDERRLWETEIRLLEAKGIR
jgi:hypothetical protein